MMNAIELRRCPRSNASCLVQVWRPEVSENLERVCAEENSLLDSLYFVTEKYVVRQNTCLLIRFRTNSGRLVNHDECLVEVVRTDSLFRGRVGVAAGLLDDFRFRFRLQDGLIVPETGFWRPSWPHVEPVWINVYA